MAEFRWGRNPWIDDEDGDLPSQEELRSEDMVILETYRRRYDA